MLQISAKIYNGKLLENSQSHSLFYDLKFMLCFTSKRMAHAVASENAD